MHVADGEVGSREGVQHLYVAVSLLDGGCSIHDGLLHSQTQTR
jgi:hypothetical protein